MPPKRMTANPVRPARYRPGKPIAPEEDSDSYGDASASEQEEPEEPAAPAPKPPRRTDVTATVSKTLKHVDLKKRFEESQKGEEARLAAELEAQQQAAKDVDGEGNSSDEYTTDSEDESEEEDEEGGGEEEAPRRKFMRPTFVKKSQREALGTAKPDAEAELKRQEEEEERKREEAAMLLEEHLKQEAAVKASSRKNPDEGDDEGDVDDTDGVDPAAERAAWKLRELLRVKRERDALEAIEKEREEIERRREMDPELRAKEDMEFVNKQKKEKMESRGKMGFMQKFYHKGAFYQDDSEVLQREYATASIEDSVKNRDVLPKYLQVRGDEVGKRGRTRWTHLTAEDTSLQEGGSPWFDKKRPKDRTGSNQISLNPSDERFKSDNSRLTERGSDDWREDRRQLHNERQSTQEKNPRIDDRRNDHRGDRWRHDRRGDHDGRERDKPYRSRTDGRDSRDDIYRRDVRDDRQRRKRSHSPRNSSGATEKRRRWDEA